MKVAFITRSTLYKVPGGDTVQIMETADHLRKLNVEITVFLSHQQINYKEFDLLHFFNLIRPADILYHIQRTNTPYVISPIFIDYSEYDKNYRKGFAGWVLKRSSSSEYIKTVARWLLLNDKLQSKQYLWKGQRKTIREILEKARMILPNSMKEYKALETSFLVSKPFAVVPNGINEQIFSTDHSVPKDERLVVCAARIEGIKNQVNLVKALTNTGFSVVLIGDAAPNHKRYYQVCKRIAGRNITFTGRLSQHQLANYFKKAKVHVLPSWFETCGLSSLEAAVSGCNIVVTDKGFTSEYFGDDAFYCDPGSPKSIYDAVSAAATSVVSNKLSEKITKHLTWSHAAKKTLEAYKTSLNK